EPDDGSVDRKYRESKPAHGELRESCEMSFALFEGHADARELTGDELVLRVGKRCEEPERSGLGVERRVGHAELGLVRITFLVLEADRDGEFAALTHLSANPEEGALI